MLIPEMQKAPAGNWGLCEIGLICVGTKWVGYKSSPRKVMIAIGS